VLAFAAGCGDGEHEQGQPIETPTTTPSATLVPSVTPTPLPLACLVFCVGTCDIDGQRCVECVTIAEQCLCRCLPGEILPPCFDDGSAHGCGGACENGPCQLTGTVCGCPPFPPTPKPTSRGTGN
jgi:hypothetical protein